MLKQSTIIFGDGTGQTYLVYIAPNSETDLQPSDPAGTTAMLDLSRTIQLAFTTKFRYDYNATNGLAIDLYGGVKLPDGSIGFDTEPFATIDHNVAPGETVQFTVAVLPDPEYMAVKLRNPDASAGITVIYMYAIRQVQ